MLYLFLSLLVLIGIFTVPVRLRRGYVIPPIAKMLQALPFQSRTFGPPKGLIPAADAAHLEGSQMIDNVHPASSHTFPALPIDDIDPSVKFNPETKTFTAQFNPTFVLELPNARIVGRNGIVITANDYVVRETAIEWRKTPEEHSIFKRLWLRPVKKSNERIAVIANKSPFCYYHWMFDMLPRLEILQRSGIVYDKLCINAPERPYHHETLKTLGIDESQIIWSNEHFHVQAKEVILPSLPAVPAQIPRWSCDFLRQHFLPKEPYVASKRIYITRKKAERRRVINENEVCNLLNNYGFEEVVLEDLTVAKQAELFASSKIIVAQHGAALTNLAFCQPQTGVLEIFSADFGVDCYLQLSLQMGLNYRYIKAPEPYSGNEGSKQHDVIVDCKELEKQLAELL